MTTLPNTSALSQSAINHPDAAARLLKSRKWRDALSPLVYHLQDMGSRKWPTGVNAQLVEFAAIFLDNVIAGNMGQRELKMVTDSIMEEPAK
jgi:hypothetical protein